MRDIVWFNPPFSSQVRNISKRFFIIFDKDSPAGHKYKSIFNRSCLKLSYSTTRSFGSIRPGNNIFNLSKETYVRPHDRRENNNNQICLNKRGSNHRTNKYNCLVGKPVSFIGRLFKGKRNLQSRVLLCQ